MTATFEPDREPSFARYREQWEAGLLAQAIAENGDLPPGHRKGVLRAWFSARYNAASFHIVDGPCHPGAGSLVWRPAGPAQYDLHYRAPYGVVCPLARVYRQPDGSWAALVIAGVRDGPDEAMIVAERAIARLCA